MKSLLLAAGLICTVASAAFAAEDCNTLLQETIANLDMQEGEVYSPNPEMANEFLSTAQEACFAGGENPQGVINDDAVVVYALLAGEFPPKENIVGEGIPPKVVKEAGEILEDTYGLPDGIIPATLQAYGI